MNAPLLDCCGLDFGTSNTVLARPIAGDVQLVALEGQSATLPSALFWDGAVKIEPLFGRAALQAYISGDEGRLLRGLKGTLGSALIHERTRFSSGSHTFSDLLGRFIHHAKTQAEVQENDLSLTRVVMGRPVHFVDDDLDADRAAEATLAEVARAVGFKEVEFQYEPVAAALTYEASVTQEELVLIVDIGGGTSDFSLLRVSPEGAQKADRAEDILGNYGIRIGGTDLDRALSLARVMPALGLGRMVGGKAPMPMDYYLDLATWHRIQSLSTPQTLSTLRLIKREAAEPEAIERLIEVIDERQGHSLAMAVEEAKIALSAAQETRIPLSTLIGGRDVTVSRAGFEASIERPLQRIVAALAEVMRQGGVAPREIGTVFLTGGSSGLPALRALVEMCLPGVRIATGDAFASVGAGLAHEAARRFR